MQAGDQETGRFRLGYQPALDGLRGIAILCVLGLHVTPSVFVGGAAGVDLFFVLSGFLITSLLVEEWERSGRISLRQFYARRALRLLPALVVWLGACCLAALLLQEPAAGRATLRGSLYALGYVANWATIFQVPLGLVTVTWSLSVEEQFYILWPLLLIVGLRVLSRKALLGTTVGLFAAVCLARAAASLAGVDWERLYHGSDTRADSLLAGCAAAMYIRWYGLPRGRWLRAAALSSAALFVWMVFRVHPEAPLLYRGGLSLLALMSVVLILYVLACPGDRVVRLLRHPLAVLLGRLSYSLYLWHLSLVLLLQKLPLHPVLLDLVQYSSSFVFALGSYYLVEQPFLRWKARLATRVARPAATLTAQRQVAG